MLTEQQRNNIHKLSCNDCLEVMHECAERLGIVTADEYSKIIHMPLRSVYAKMQYGQIKYFEISAHKFPIINS